MNNKKNSNTLWLALGLVLLLLAAGLGGYLLLHSGLTKPQATVSSEVLEENVPESMPTPSLEPPVIQETVPENQDSTSDIDSEQVSEAEEEATYESPVDFEALWTVNEDVCAWLYIPGADISMPIMQHPTDNSYYLTHDAQKASSSSGAIFIEDYNSADFSDMCTVVYGHRMYSGEMFGTLQATYSDAATFDASKYIVVYLPDREIVYEVFAAVPYDNSHILYYNDFDDQLSYRKFINSIYATTGIDATLVTDLKPTYGDKLLILSTCLWGDKDNRYLVLAKEQS
jgi:sortase B